MNNFLLKLSAYTIQKALVMGLMAGGFYFFALYNDGSAIEKAIKTAEENLKKEQARKVETDKALAKLETVRNEFGILSDQFKVATAKLPTDIQIPEILKTIDGAAATSGVYIKSKEPTTPEMKEIVEDKPIRVVVEGSYSEITLFLYKIATAERVVKIKKLAFAANTDQRKQTKKISLDVTFSNYRFVGVKPGATPSAGPNAAPKKGGKG